MQRPGVRACSPCTRLDVAEWQHWEDGGAAGGHGDMSGLFQEDPPEAGGSLWSEENLWG